jgi:uncharacterized membrane protein YeaQ/YmgE (transglycosylase-associated protein family)
MHKLTFRENIFQILTAIVSAVISFFIVFMLTLYIACLISPAVYIDNETGKELSVMPIGQTIIALIFATIGGVLVIIFMFKYLRKKVSKS